MLCNNMEHLFHILQQVLCQPFPALRLICRDFLSWFFYISLSCSCNAKEAKFVKNFHLQPWCCWHYSDKCVGTIPISSHIPWTSLVSSWRWKQGSEKWGDKEESRGKTTYKIYRQTDRQTDRQKKRNIIPRQSQISWTLISKLQILSEI